jgi:hypothetical protein
MMTINNPRVRRIAGNDNNMTIGLTTRLTKAKINPETTITVN